MELTPAFWHGKRVLVTGHTGFKGSWLSLWLQRLGADVTGYALEPPTEPSLFEVAGVGRGMNSLTGDVRDLDGLEAVVRDTRPEIVLHLAAQSLVRASYERPVETYETNVMGTVHVLEAIRRVGGVRAAVCVTSDKCYENLETGRAYREGDPMGGYDPYSSSKGCDELVAAAYRRSFFPLAAYADHGVALASARAGNVIGGGDWARDRLVVDIVRAFSSGEPVEIRYPDAVRPWQHVLEPLRGYLELCEALWREGPSFAEAWNFGPDAADVKTVAWIADRLAGLWGDGARWEPGAGDHPHEAGLLMLDATKARTVLGWTPRLPLDEGLAWIVEWYRSYQRGEDMGAIANEQIDRYEAKVPA